MSSTSEWISGGYKLAWIYTMSLSPAFFVLHARSWCILTWPTFHWELLLFSTSGSLLTCALLSDPHYLLRSKWLNPLVDHSLTHLMEALTPLPKITYTKVYRATWMPAFSLKETRFSIISTGRFLQTCWRSICGGDKEGKIQPGRMVHVYNPSYLRGREKRIV